MTMNGELAARLFVRLYTSLLDDEAMVERSYAAVGVYAVGLLLSKRTATDGLIPVQLFRRDAALRPGTPVAEALEELAGAGLITIAGDHVTIRSWTKYNALSADIVAEIEAKRVRGQRAAHERWHDGEFDDCDRCRSAVPPGQSTPDAGGMQDACDPDAPGNAQRQRHRHSHSHSDPAAMPPASPDSGEAEALVVAVADRLIETLGYIGQLSSPAERRYVERALGRGWTPEQLVDVAAEAASRDNLDDVRQYLLGCLRFRANNNDPDADAAPPPPTTDDDGFPDPAEGWDDTETVKQGLADARAALPSPPSEEP